MDKPLKSVPDPIVNDILYSLLYNASAEQKRSLHGKYLKAAMSEKAAKAFLKSASDEDKKYIFSKMGFRFAWTFYRDSFKDQYLRELLNEYEKDNKVKVFKDILSMGVVISGDREYNRLLGLLSSSIHHPSFYQDVSFLNIGFHIKKWKKRFFNPVDMQMREAEESAIEIAKLMLMGTVTMSYMKSLMGISEVEMKLLLYFYPESHRKISDSYVMNLFSGAINKTGIRVGLKTLMKGGLIESDPGQSERSYTISASGVIKVNEFFKTVFSKMKY